MKTHVLIMLVCALMVMTLASVSAQPDTRASRIISEFDIRDASGDSDSDPLGIAVLSDDSFVFFDTEAGSHSLSDALVHAEWASGFATIANVFTVIASEAEIQALRGGTSNATVRDVAADASDNVYIVATGGDQAILRIGDADAGAGISFGSAVSLVGPGAIGSGLATDSLACDVDSTNDILYVLVDTFASSEDTTTNGIYRVGSASTATGANLTLVASYADLNAAIPVGDQVALGGADIFGVNDICVLPDGNVACAGSEMADSSDPADGSIFLISDPAGTPVVSLLISGEELETNVGNNFGNYDVLLDCDASGNLFIFQWGGQTSPDDIARYTYSGGVATFSEVYAEENLLQDAGGYTLVDIGPPHTFTPDIDNIGARGFAVGQNLDLWVTVTHDFSTSATPQTRGTPGIFRIRDYQGATSSIEGKMTAILEDQTLAALNTNDDDYDSDPSGACGLTTGGVVFYESEPNDAAATTGTEDSIMLWTAGGTSVIATEAQIRAADPNSSISTDDTADMRFSEVTRDASNNLYLIMFENVTSGDNSAGEEFIFRMLNTGGNSFSAPERIVVVNDGPTGSDGAVALDVDLATGRLYVLRDAGGINQQTEVPVNAPDGTNTGLFYLDNPATVAAGDNALTQAVSGTAVAAAVTPSLTPGTLGMDDIVVRTLSGGTDVILSVPLTQYDDALGGHDGDLVQLDPGAGTATLFMESTVWTAAFDAVTATTLVGGVTLEAADLENDDGNDEIILFAVGMDGDLDDDRAEVREGLVTVSSDGTTATLLANQQDIFLEVPRLASVGDLSAFGNAMSYDADSDLLYIFFSNQVETLTRTFFGVQTAAESWTLYR